MAASERDITNAGHSWRASLGVGAPQLFVSHETPSLKSQSKVKMEQSEREIKIETKTDVKRSV